MPRLILAACLGLFLLPATVTLAEDAPKLETPEQRASYAIGLQIGDNMKKQGLDFIDDAALITGVRDALEGADKKLTDEEITKAFEVIQKRVADAAAAKSEKAMEAGKAFLAKNKDADGVVTTESGLQYKILTEGSGDKPAATDQVQVHYEGKLLDGTVFDSSYARGAPAEFPVGGVIKGWIEALQLMPVGSIWEVYIPSELAYGARGAGGDIGPNETLIFKVELIKIMEK